MKKTTWKKFIEAGKSGLEYRGSSTKGLEQVKEFIDNNTDETIMFQPNRHLVSGVSVLKFKTERDTFSYLDKKGTVLEYKNHFIISVNNVSVVYYKGV